MIKKFSVIKDITTYKTKLHLIEFNPKLELAEKDIQYLVGGIYRTEPMSAYAFYEADENGQIISEQPLISDEGLNSYQEIFQEYGYVQI